MSRKEDGSYDIEAIEPEPSASRLQAFIPWRASARSLLAVPHGGERGHGAAVGAIRGVCQPRSVRVEVIYLFVDGIAERLHLGQPREAVLAAWGVLADGHKVLLHNGKCSRRFCGSSRNCGRSHHQRRREALPDDGGKGITKGVN